MVHYSARRRRVAAHRLVLLALIVPIIALLVVFWLLLPGGVASMSYTPSQFSQAAQVQPGEWQSRTVSVRGYIARGCPGAGDAASCTLWLLLDQPSPRALGARQAQALGALQIAPQRESFFHALFRHVIPGLPAPFPSAIRAGQQVTVTGTLQRARSPLGLQIFAPKDL